MPVCFDLFYPGGAEAIRLKRAARALERKGVHPKFARVIVKKKAKSNTNPLRRR